MPKSYKVYQLIFFERHRHVTHQLLCCSHCYSSSLPFTNSNTMATTLLVPTAPKKKSFPCFPQVSIMSLSPHSTPGRRRRRRGQFFFQKAFILAVLLGSLPAANTALMLTTNHSPIRRSLVVMKVSSSSKESQTGLFEFVPASRSSTTTSSSKIPRQQQTPSSCGVTEDRHEFEMNLGRAVDTLKQDYPDILTDAPDFAIYSPNLEIIDPAGVKLHGLTNYKNAFRLVHTIVNLFYCPERSLLTFRLVYDWARNDIRVSWNAEVVPKAIFGGSKTTLHVDGISVYKVDPSDGKIVQHRVEHLMINDNLIAPERGIIHALQKQADSPDCSIPVFSVDGSSGGRSFGENGIVKFQSSNPLQFLLPSKSTSLFSSSSAMAGSNDPSQYPELDWEAFENKNKSRKKFGLDPLTPEEFAELQAQVQQMEVQQKRRLSDSTKQRQQQQPQEPNVFEKLLGNVLEDTCESNFDCQRPEVCCDFGFTKKCCTSGVFVGQERFGERATVPVVEGPYPPGLGPQDDPRNFLR